MPPQAARALRLEVRPSLVRYKGVDCTPKTAEGVTSANVKVGGPDGVGVHTDFVVIDDQDDAACSILMGLPWLRAIGGVIDMKNNTLEVMKDNHTKVNIPALKVAKYVRQPPSLGPVTARQSEFLSASMDVSDVVRAIDSRAPPNAMMATNLYDLIQSEKARGGFSISDQQLEFWEKVVELTLRCLERGEVDSFLTEAFYEVMISILAMIGHRGEEHVSSGPEDSDSDSEDDHSTDSSISSEEDEEELLPSVELAVQEMPPLVEPEDDDGESELGQPEEEDLCEKLEAFGLPVEEDKEDDYAYLFNASKTEEGGGDFVKVEVPGFPMPVQVGRGTPQHIQQALVEQLQKHRGAFALSMEDLDKPACLPPHRIILKEGAQPSVVRPYKRSPVQEDIIAKMAREQYKVGILENSASPWCSQAMCLPKKIPEGVQCQDLPPEDVYRAVVDYRPVNERSIDDRYPMPVVSEVVENAAGATLFSKFDINGAFYQIPLEEESRAITAFQTKDGFYQYTRMPMGLKNAPATFMRGMDIALGGLQHVSKYFDDCIAHTALDYEEHLNTIGAVLQRMEDYNLKISPTKCTFFSTKAKFTGFILENGTLSTDPEKTAAVDNMKPWLGKEHTQRFLGFISYYGHRFKHNLAGETKPLRNLLHKDNPFVWTEECQEATEHLKREIRERLTLWAPDFNKPFKLAVDYSATALAAVLSQDDEDGNERPVAFASRTTTAAEAKLSATMGELAALAYGVKYFYRYLYDSHFTIYTDHEALSYLAKNKDTNNKLGRLAVLLSDYKYDIVYKRGKWNGNADTLSREPPTHDCKEELDFQEPIMEDFVARTRTLGGGEKTATVTTDNTPRILMFKTTPEKASAETSGGAEDGGRTAEAGGQRGGLPSDYPLPKYQTQDNAEEDEEGEPIEADAKCEICGVDNDPSNLLVCEACKGVLHKYCLEDIMPDNLILEKEYICHKCRPYDVEPPTSAEEQTTKYLDIVDDVETIQLLQGLTSSASARATERAKRYKWDHKQERLRTKDGRLVPKKEERKALALQAHYNLGHRGFRAVADALRLWYAWKDMRVDIQTAINEECMQCKLQKLKPVVDPELHSIQPSNLFMRWTVDLMMMPTTSTGFKYVAVAVDSYSKCVQTAALKDKTANSVVKFVSGAIIYTYGKPAEIMCDQGGEFMGELAKLCKKMGIKITRGTSYHPQTQGLVERANRTLSQSLVAYMRERTTDKWEEGLPMATFSMRALKQATTRYSPFFLMHGVEPHLPVAMPGAAQDLATKEEMEEAAELTRLEARSEDLNEAHGRVKGNIAKAQENQARSYKRRKTVDRKATILEELYIGAAVWVRNPRKTKKAPEACFGPFMIKELDKEEGTIKIGNQEE
eukprot:scaffold54424_cov18-Tisochrysis_lutea.AAC.1